jgi:hypothetical protein
MPEQKSLAPLARKIKRIAMWACMVLLAIFMIPAVVLLIGTLPQLLVNVLISLALGPPEHRWGFDWPRKWVQLGKELLVQLATDAEPSAFATGLGKGLGGILGQSTGMAEVLGRAGYVFVMLLWLIVGLLIPLRYILWPLTILCGAPFWWLRVLINRLGYSLTHEGVTGD